MSTDNNKENKIEIVKVNIFALQKNSSGLVRRALQDIDIFANNPNLLVKPITKINPIDGAEMVWVPGGTFNMGSPDGVGYEDEHPSHQVTLSGYWMYKYPVTVAQYCAFCEETSRKLPYFPDGYSWEGKLGWNDFTLQQHPIVKVNWHDCKAYAVWAGVSLPTEAQWEYASRGPQGNNYPWGGTATASDLYNGWDQTKCSNHYNSSKVGKSTWPVGSFQAGASWCGAQDMAGNVLEWCDDWYDNYLDRYMINPTGPVSGDVSVLRSGSWKDGFYDNCRSASRYLSDPFNPYGCYYGEFDVGFRCVYNLPEP